MTRNFFVLFLLVFFWGLVPAKAQQEGSVAIATHAEVKDTLPGGGVECLERAGKILTADKAADYCLKLAKVEADRSKRVANEAADATKASRPQVIFGGRYNRWNSGAVVVSGGAYYTSRPRYYRTPRVPRHHRDRP